MDTLKGSIILLVYMLICVGSYYLIFNKHHKRNQLKNFELMQLFTNYFITLTMTIIVIMIGIQFFKEAYNSIADRNEEIAYIVLAILTISGAIINFIMYIKRNLKDLDPVKRVNYEKRMMKTAEILEIICFGLFFLMPLWLKGTMKEAYYDRERELFFKYIIASIAAPIISVFLLYQLNPLDIRKTFRRFVLKEKKEETTNNNDNDNAEKNDGTEKKD